MNSPNARDEMRGMMGEASVLPAGDPMRREVEERIAGDDGWAEQEWLKLLEEAEILRLVLPRVDVSERLEERLQDIAEGSKILRLPFGKRTWLAAAAIVLILFTVGQGMRMSRKMALEPKLMGVAMLALDDHVNDRLLMVATAEPADLAASLAGEAGFSVVLPELGDDFHLQGGRQCRWGSNKIVYSLWENHGHPVSLCQFPRDIKGLPEQLEVEIVCCPEPGIDGEPTDILIWTEGDTGYAMVGPHELLCDYKLEQNTQVAAGKAVAVNMAAVIPSPAGILPSISNRSDS